MDLLNTETPTAEVPPSTSEPVAVETNSAPQESLNWLDAIPESYRQEGSVNRHGSMDELLSSYTHAQSMLGRKNGIPDFENDSPEVISKFREQLGVPSDADSYQLDTPEGFEPNEQFGAFKQMALDGNVPNETANKFFQMHQEGINGAVQQVNDAREAEITTAFEEFQRDPNFSDMSNNTRNIMNQIDPSGEFLNEQVLAGLGAQAPMVVRFLDKAAKMIGDDSVPKAMSTTSHGSYEEAYSSIRNNPNISDDTKNQQIADLTARYK